MKLENNEFISFLLIKKSCSLIEYIQQHITTLLHVYSFCKKKNGHTVRIQYKILHINPHKNELLNT